MLVVLTKGLDSSNKFFGRSNLNKHLVVPNKVVFQRGGDQHFTLYTVFVFEISKELIHCLAYWDT